MSRPPMLAALIILLAVSSALSACAQVPPAGSAAIVPSPHSVTDPASPSPCDAARAADAIGQLPLADLVEAARKAAGAEVVRTLRQGQPITKEFRIGRLNLLLDAGGRIASANCS